MKNDTSKIIDMFQKDLLLDASRHLGGMKVSISVHEQSIMIEKSQYTAYHNLNIALKAPHCDERDKTVIGFAILIEASSAAIQSELKTGTKSLLGKQSKTVFVKSELMDDYLAERAKFDSLPKAERALRTADFIRENQRSLINPLDNMEFDIYGMELIIAPHLPSSLLSKFHEIDSTTDNLTVITRRIKFLSAVCRLHFSY
ncbi:hypothetical protein OTK49_02475 [Vibrio coralliirubri]|uniref:hypothetical protein n=1 Tax=Vibrio coralliirubri TaxID=1516159 RepID=UPI0022838CF6|nr:hypothetical protein [Vibrio coralliirubri]MCY9861382.1 hypothetical protein [Vibrio coralliirubri]